MDAVATGRSTIRPYDRSTFKVKNRPFQTVVCILNGVAGSDTAAKAQGHVAAFFAQAGISAEVITAKTGDDLPRLARQAVKDGAQLIVAGGGDGTINCVASAIVNSGIILGVLPLGTLNHFAKDMGIPLVLEDAVGNLLRGRIAQVDVGEVNGHIFLNNSSLGLYPEIVRQRQENQRRGYGKWLAFAGALFYVLGRYTKIYVTLRSMGQKMTEEETPFIFVGNNHYEISGLRIGHRARLDAGRLWVYRAPHVSRLGLLRLALHTLRGRPDPGELAILDTTEFHIRTRRKRLHVATDGEVRTLAGDLQYRILPKALNVLVPAHPGAGE
jgi:diacylglycerol kinase family enzyme